MALDTVQDYVNLTRTLLQDTVNSPYRYTDLDLVISLTTAFPRAKKLRPDLFLTYPTLPSFVVNDTTPVNFDPMYRMALVFFMVGFAQLRDDEEVQDQRAAAFMNLFVAELTTVQQ